MGRKSIIARLTEVVPITHFEGYRTNRVAGRVTFGFVARESHDFSWLCLPRSCEYCIAGLCVAAP